MTAIRRTVAPLLIVLAAMLLPPGARGDDGPTPDVTATPAHDTFIVIPLRVHVLTEPHLPEVDCRLSDADIARILRKVNGIWEKAGIHWGLESLVRETASDRARFSVARDLDDGGNLGLFRILLPEESRAGDVVHLYYLHELPVNGVWLGREAIVKETARLREVEGGIDEPIPRVSAHELGHALGLRHRQDRTNLLASGTTGTRLNAAEVQTARERAKQIPGAATVAELRRMAKAAEAAGDRDRAHRLWTWLAAIPGAGPEALATRDRLGTEGVAKPEPGSN